MRRPQWFKRWLYAYCYGAKLPWYKRLILIVYLWWRERPIA